MSDGGEIVHRGLRLQESKIVTCRPYESSTGRMVEVRFLLDDDDGHDEAAETPREIQT